MTDAFVARVRAGPVHAADPPLDDAGLVAVLCSVPPVVTWVGLRRVRRAVLPPGRLGAEADVRRDFAESVGTSRLELSPDFRREARERLRSAAAEVGIDGELASLLRGPRLGSPLLELETELTFAYVSRPDYRAVAQEAFADCIRTAGREQREGILDWAAGALHRVPRDVLACPAGWLLAQMCLTRLGIPEVPTDFEGLDDLDGDLVRDASRYLPRTIVGLARDDSGIDFGPVTRTRRIAVSAPTLGTLLGTVSWQSDGVPRRQDLRLGPGESRTLSTGRGEVTITDLAGHRYVLPGYGDDVPPEVVELEHRLDDAEAAHSRNEVLPARILRSADGSGYIVRFLDTGLDGVLPAMHARTPWQLLGKEGLVIATRIVRLDRGRQRIVCEEVQPLRLDDYEQWRGPFLGRVVDVGPGRPGVWIDGRTNNVAHGGVMASLVEQDAPVAASAGSLVDVAVMSTLDGHRATSDLTLIGSRGSRSGQVYRGTVNSIADVGAFVTFDSVRFGLLHLTEWGEVPLVRDDTLLVAVLDVDSTGRIALTRAGAITTGLDRIVPNQKLAGTVTKILQYGLFVRIGRNIGLLHRSEIPAGAEFTEGQPLEVTVISVDVRSGRIALGTSPRKAASTSSWLDPVAAKLKATGSPGTATLLHALEKAGEVASLPEVARAMRSIAAPERLPLRLTDVRTELQHAVSRPLDDKTWYGFERFALFVAATLPPSTRLWWQTPTAPFVVAGDGPPDAEARTTLEQRVAALRTHQSADLEVARAVLGDLLARLRLPAPLTELAPRFLAALYARQGHRTPPHTWFGYGRFSSFLVAELPSWVTVEAIEDRGLHLVRSA